MANDAHLRCITCWISILCAMALAFGSSYGASGLREIRGSVWVGAQPIRGVVVTIVDAKEAAARYDVRLAAAKTNLAGTINQAAKSLRPEGIYRERPDS